MYAAELWDAMGRCWPIPRKEEVLDTGNDWLLLLLANCSDSVRCMIIMLIWRIWQVRSDVTHGKEATLAAVSTYLSVIGIQFS